MNSKLNINKKSIEKNTIFILFFSIFIFSYYIRKIFLPESISGTNLIAIICIFILLIVNKIKLTKKNIIVITLLMILFTLFFATQVANNKDFFYTITIPMLLIFPMALLSIEIKYVDFKYIFSKLIFLLNIFIILLLIFGVIDQFTNNTMAKIFSNLFNDISYTKMAYETDRKRYLSFMGHPLYNAQIFITVYILNLLDYKYFNKNTKKNIIMTIISIIGVAITGSKTAIVLMSISLIVASINNIKLIVFQILIAIGVLKSGILSTTIERFKLESLTTGRTEKWQEILSNNLMPLKFFTGYGYGATFEYNNIMSWASAAFEYPIKMFALEYGVLFSVLLHILIFFIPFIIFLRRRHFFILITYSIIFLDVSTYNGLALGQDQMILFCFIAYIIMNLSTFIYNNEINNQLERG